MGEGEAQMRKVLTISILAALSISSVAIAKTATTARKPASAGCSAGDAKQAADNEAANSNNPTCTKRAYYKSLGYNDLQISHDCANDFWAHTSVKSSDGGQYVVDISGVTYSVKCAYDNGGGDHEDAQCNCQASSN
jgi:hypothetical protein